MLSGRGWEVGVTTTREQLASATWPRFYIFYQEGTPHMAENKNVQDLLNATAFDSHNDKLGGVKEVFLDAETGQPFFVEVGHGLFGMSSSLVPLRGSHLEGEELHLAFVKDAIKDAPDFDVEQGITPEEQDRLLAHYHLTDAHEGDRYATEVPPVGTGEPRTAAEHPAPVTDADDNSVVRSEERLNVSKDNVATGTVRLHKYVVHDTETVEVPVTREEVRVERTPVKEGEEYVGEISEGGAAVTLHEERVNVEKETVPVERVSLHKDVVRDTETVSEDVAKEQIEIEDETGRSTK